MKWWWWAVALAAVGCDDSGGGTPAPSDAAVIDAGALDAARPDAAPRDAGLDARPDAAAPDAAAPDAAPLDAEAPDAFAGDAGWLPLDPALLPPAAAPLRAGVAVRRMDVPLGIGTSGYGPNQGVPYATPYQVAYPGTRHLHLHPNFRAVVLEAGDGNRLYVIRTDTIGISARIRRDLVDRLTARYGEGVDRQLIIAATHTHAGPGRLIDKPLWRIIQDVFWPEFYERVLDGLEATVVAAVDDLEPARLGTAVAETTALHGDRRCANPPETDPALPILRIDRADGTLKGLVLFHSIHGTVLSMRDATLSQDVTGAIEAKVAESFEDPVFVMFMNGAAADVSPSSPGFPAEPDAAPWPEPYTRTELIGRAAAEVVQAAAGAIETHTDVVLHSRTARVPLNRQVLGYPDGLFPFEHGAVYCGVAQEERCVDEAPYSTELLRGCLPFPDAENSAPTQAPLTVGQIDGLGFITTPGEFSVSLGRVAREAAEEALGLPVVIMGYAQEYTGYSLTEEDWWHAGYEASGALWGPRQGDWLARAISSLARSYANPRLPLAFADQAPLPPRAPADFEPFAVQPSVEAPIILAEVGDLAPADVATFAFSGGDPWLGNPIVHLEQRDEAGEFHPVHLGGQPVTSDGYVITLTLEPEPPYAEEAEARRLRWIATMPAVRPFGGGPALRGGTFRFVAEGRALVVGDAEPQRYRLAGAPFQVAP